MLPVHRNESGLAPFRGSPSNRFATLFDRLFDDGYFSQPTTQGWSALPVSMWEDEGHVYVETDLPGVTDKDIEVSVHQGQLVIKGERKCERNEGGFDNRSYGRFEQLVTLPSAVDANRVQAKLANGVLSLSFPKSEEAKPRRIAIKSE